MRFVERFILLMGAALVLNLNAVASEKLENTKTNETTVASLGLYYYPNFPEMHTVSGHHGLGKCQGDCNTIPTALRA